MNKAFIKTKLTLLCSILLVIMLLAGTSYAYFTQAAVDSKTQSLTAANCASISFESNNNVISSNSSNGGKSFAEMWDDNNYYVFKVTNKCDHEIKVNLGLQNQSTTSINPSKVKVYINRLNEYNEKRMQTLTEDIKMTANGETMYNVYTDYLPSKGSQSYRMNIDYIADNTTINKVYEGKVVAVGSIVTWEKYENSAPKGWNTASKGTLLYALRNDSANKIQNPISTPGLENSAIVGSSATTDGTVQIDGLFPYSDDFDLGLGGKTIYYSASRTKNVDGTYSLVNPTSLVLSNTNLSGTLKGKYFTFNKNGGDVFYVNDVKIKDSGSTDYYIYYSYQSAPADLTKDEAIMAMEPDEYSVSYYYRGAVKNNYVVFADKCWRIVRVMGNGAIKLVLENGDSASCTSSSPFVKSSSSVNLGIYGTNKNSSFKGSTAETTLSTWASNNLSSYTGSLEDIIYCSDVTIRNKYYYPSLYDGNNSIAYTGAQRFNRSYTDEVPRPTFNCPQGASSLVSTSSNQYQTSDFENNLTSSKISVTTGLKSKVGLLTADEVLFAGASIGYEKDNVKVYIGNQKYYLATSSNTAYYTITPALYTNKTPYVYAVGYNYVAPITSSTGSNAYRPVIALKSSSTISGGNGTASNPYVIGTPVEEPETDVLNNSASSSTTENSPAFNGPISIKQVESITLVDTNAIPAKAITSWDVGEKQNGSVIAYTLDDDSNGLYELYIGQEGGVVLPQDSERIFAYYSNLKTMDVTNIDTSNVTTMYAMFYLNKASTITGLTSFDTSNVTSMEAMFQDTNFTTLDLSSFNTSNVTHMGWLFCGSSKLTTITGLNKFNTSKVTNMRSMFYLIAVKTLDLSNFDTSKVTNMSYMFGDSSTTSLTLTSFDTSKVTDMSHMFQNSKVTGLILTNFNTSNVTDMSYMFTGIAKRKTLNLDFSGFNTSKVTNMEGMFSDVIITQLMPTFDTNNVTNMKLMFADSTIDYLDLSSFSINTNTDLTNMFSGALISEGYAKNDATAAKFNDSSITGIPDVSQVFGPYPR